MTKITSPLLGELSPIKPNNVWFAALVIPFLCVLVGQTPSHAQVSAVTFNDVGDDAVSSVNATEGYSFTARSTFTVPDLSFYDLGQNGLTSSHPVGLWTSAGTLLGEVTVDAGTVDPIQNGFRYHHQGRRHGECGDILRGARRQTLYYLNTWTNGIIPSASYRKIFNPPIHSSTIMIPARVTATPRRLACAAISRNLVDMLV